MYRFEHNWAFWLIVIVVMLSLTFILHYRWRKKVLKKVANHSILQTILPNFSITKSFWKKIFAIIGLSFLIIALANPQMGSQEHEVKKEGIDIVLALDVSNSMMAEDLAPNRLERAKRGILQLINKLENDRLCIIVFGGQSYVQLPLTTDYSAAKLFVNTIHTGLIPTQGTAIGSAIDLGIESLDLNAPTQKAIVVITDGENHEDDAITAAQNANQKGIKVYTIGMGSTTGAPIPLYKGGRKIPNTYRKDKEQQTVTTRLNETMLRDIAKAGNGVFQRSTNAKSGLNTIRKELDNLEKTEFESKVFVDYDDYFQFFLAIAIAFLFFETILSKRTSTLLQKLNLFQN